jgi:hypothetical protein
MVPNMGKGMVMGTATLTRKRSPGLIKYLEEKLHNFMMDLFKIIYTN